MTRRCSLLAAAAGILACIGGPAGFADAQEAPPPAAFVVDVSEAPDLKDWGDKARALCEEWYPKISEFLATDGFTPPTKVALVFRKEMAGVAGTSGAKIAISARWVSAHPDDFGMVIHELTHVVQSYPKYRPAWLVEGIADYIRYWRFEPDSPRRRFDPKRSNYRRGYQPAAALLAWLDERERGIIRKLNAALRAGECTDGTIADLSGKDADRWWDEFVKSRRDDAPPRAAARTEATPPAGYLADIGPAPPVALTDAEGRPFELSSLRGKAVLVSFIYTTCTGSCPATTLNLARVRKTLKEAGLWASRVEFVSISLDPARDTPEALAHYAKLYDADPIAWHFLTGPPERVARVIDAWGMWAKIGPSGLIDHPSRIFLVDPRGREREIYNLEFLKADSVVQDLRAVLAEAAAPDPN